MTLKRKTSCDSSTSDKTSTSSTEAMSELTPTKHSPSGSGFRARSRSIRSTDDPAFSLMSLRALMSMEDVRKHIRECTEREERETKELNALAEAMAAQDKATKILDQVKRDQAEEETRKKKLMEDDECRTLESLMPCPPGVKRWDWRKRCKEADKRQKKAEKKAELSAMALTLEGIAAKNYDRRTLEKMAETPDLGKSPLELALEDGAETAAAIQAVKKKAKDRRSGAWRASDVIGKVWPRPGSKTKVTPSSKGGK